MKLLFRTLRDLIADSAPSDENALKRMLPSPHTEDSGLSDRPQAPTQRGACA